VEQLTVVHVWWYALSAVAVVNLLVWALSSAAFFRRRASTHPHYQQRWPHLLLSAGYVLGCGFRSFLPRADVQRIVVVDSWLSSVLVGRSVATIAELCFAAQWALVLRELSTDHQHAAGVWLSRLVFPLIFVAELFSWYAVLSTSYLGNTLEQSIWTGTVALIASALFPLWRRAEGPLRRFLATSIVGSVAFVCFMCTVDVPMYLTRWLADEASGRSYLSLADGLHDVATRWVVTHELAVWREELAWMALYFSLAVWFSIALVHTPKAGARAQLHSQPAE
jgi:hypothetical protein